MAVNIARAPLYLLLNPDWPPLPFTAHIVC